MPTSSALIQTTRMQLYTEKVLVNISQLLKLIKEVRAEVLLYDFNDVKKDRKATIDSVKRENEATMISLGEKFREVEKLEQLAILGLRGLESPGDKIGVKDVQ